MQEPHKPPADDLFGSPTPTEMAIADRDALKTFISSKDWNRNGNGRIHDGDLLSAETQQPDLFTLPTEKANP